MDNLKKELRLICFTSIIVNFLRKGVPDLVTIFRTKQAQKEDSQLMEDTSQETRFKIENPDANIQLYSAATPNGLKVACMLEEIHALRSEKEDFTYEAHTVDIRHYESRSKHFLAHLCPNGKIPVIVEPTHNQKIWESGACLMFLAEKYHELLPKDGPLRYDVLNWTFWGSAELSTKLKLFGYFYQYCKHDIRYVTNKVSCFR